MDQQVETNLPPGFQEVRVFGESLTLTPKDIPWAKEDESLDINLAKVILKGEVTFYLGNAVRGKLVDIMNRAFKNDSEENQRSNALFYSRLPGFITNDRWDIRTIQHPSTSYPIYYVAARNGNRVYFARYPNINDDPVIVRLAACRNKNEEKEIVKIISTDKKI